MFDTQIPVDALYIHWPFCPYKCHFCPFIALASQDEHMPAYHEALKQEIIYFAQTQERRVELATIFMGGGTPSTYPPHLLLDMFDTLYKWYQLTSSYEFTIEVNPGTVDDEKLKMWKEMGINRLSIGVQSLNDKLLAKLNRHQKASDVYALLDKACGLFDAISVDLIIGLPGVTQDDWKDLIQTIVTWPIKHVSLYVLMVHEDTPLYFGVKSKRINLPADDEIIDLYEWSVEFLEAHGFMQYEISNFAREGYQSQHNSRYWQRIPYKGFGLGACSFDGSSRFQNEKNLMTYMSTIMKQGTALMMSERLTPAEVWTEMLMLGIRQRNGIERALLMNQLSQEKKEAFDTEIVRLQQLGLLEEQVSTIKLTARGRALEQEVAVRLALF